MSPPRRARLLGRKSGSSACSSAASLTAPGASQSTLLSYNAWRCATTAPKIEHRLFSQITMNWRGRPLTSHETILKLIGATTTDTGLTVTATLDTGTYPTGIKISDREMAALPITRNAFHGDWNYTLHPTRDTPELN